MKKTRTEKKKPFTFRSFWIWGLGAVLTGILIGIGYLFWYTPKAYNPIDAGSTEQASVYLTHELGPNFFNQVQYEKPFELIIPQSELNDIINREFASEGFGDDSFSSPQIIFSDKSILLMGTLAYDGISSVLSIKAMPDMDSEGKIDLNIQFIRLGMVPVSTLATKLAQKAFDENRSCFEDDPIAEENIQAIIHKEPFDPIFPFSIENRQYQIRLTDFSITEGTLRLVLLPQRLNSPE